MYNYVQFSYNYDLHFCILILIGIPLIQSIYFIKTLKDALFIFLYFLSANKYKTKT